MPPALKSVRKSAIRLAGYYGLVAVGIIVFGSPLFRVLSFEYASLVALFGSLPVMWFAARYTQEHAHEKLLSILIPIWQAVGVAIVVPVLISLISVQSCDLFYGLGYYVQIVVLSSLIGTIFGAFVGSLAKSKKTRILLVIAVWLVTFFLSLLPGYVAPQIFTYGWQYGFFPGLIWDDYIELGGNYYLANIGYLLIASLALFVQLDRNKGIPFWNTKRRPWAMLFIVIWIVYIQFGGVRGALSGLSHGKVQEKLKGHFGVGSVTIYYDPKMSEERSKILRYETAQYLKEIYAFYPSVDTSMRIDVYVYPNSDVLHEFVGTRRASIAKPWLGTLHIAEENLSSLKHELVHVLLKPYGSFPFYASWSTGLTEGSAEAVEADYDGLRTSDDLSRWALAMNYASGITPFMQFTGFASTAPTTSYILSGSFAKYLIATYGPEKFLALYTSRDYEEIYGKSLEALDAEWQRALRIDMSMSQRDSIMARYYFERTSVVNQACLRRIGRLVHEAQEAYNASDHAAAFDLYRQAYSEDSTRTDALRGMIFSKIKQNKFADAVALLSDDPRIDSPNGRVTLSNLLGDMKYLASDDTLQMKARYDEAIRYAPNDTRFISALGVRLILEDSVFNIGRYLDYRYGLIGDKLPQALYDHAWESPMPDSVRVGYVLLRTLNNEARGEYSAAIHEWEALPVFVDPNVLSPRVRKAYDIIDRKVKRWAEALSLH